MGKLADIIKSIKESRKQVPTAKHIKEMLKGSEFEPIDSKSELDDDTMLKIKQFIIDAIKNEMIEKKKLNKLGKVYFYISIGGTQELKNQFKIEFKDKPVSRVLSPKGCDKYCTENQLGKPQNWVKLPVITLPNGMYADKIKMWLNDTAWVNSIGKYDGIDIGDVGLVKKDSDVYEIAPERTDLIYVIRLIRKAIFNDMENDWFAFNYENNAN